MSAGKCFINGAIRQFDNVNFTVPNGDSKPRYDSITLKFDLSQRNIIASYNQGESSVKPAKPIPTNTEEIYELLLCYIYVAADAHSISQSVIEDCRGTELCPYVFNLVQDIDTSALFAQYEAQWELLKGACAQDAEAVIAAWEGLNTVKKVNGIVPVNGNVSMPLNKIPDGGEYYKSRYFIQAGQVTSASSPTASVTFPKKYSSTPYILLSYPTSSALNSVPVVTSATASGFDIKKNSANTYNTVNWIAFGKLPA